MSDVKGQHREGFGESSNALTRYFEFVERVDLYFEWIMTLSKHVSDLRRFYKESPRLRETEYRPTAEGRRDEILWEMLFSIEFRTKFSALSMIDPNNASLKADSPDPVNFAFYTCYCFQWNLFETFVKDQVFGLLEAGLLSPEQEKKLNTIGRYQTENLLKYIDSGQLFGKTPFVNLHPEGLSIKNSEQVAYQDLDAIRIQRNNFVHGVEAPQIKTATKVELESEYERMRQILSQFAAKVHLAVLGPKGLQS